MGTGYKGNTDHHFKLSENLTTVTSKYPVTDGYFGRKGQSQKERVRNIESENPLKTAKDFYDMIANGGETKKIPKGEVATLADGTVVTFRPVSTSDGSPAVDINITPSTSDGTGLKSQKIHFVQNKE